MSSSVINSSPPSGIWMSSQIYAFNLCSLLKVRWTSLTQFRCWNLPMTSTENTKLSEVIFDLDERS